MSLRLLTQAGRLTGHGRIPESESWWQQYYGIRVTENHPGGHSEPQCFPIDDLRLASLPASRGIYWATLSARSSSLELLFGEALSDSGSNREVNKIRVTVCLNSEPEPPSLPLRVRRLSTVTAKLTRITGNIRTNPTGLRPGPGVSNGSCPPRPHRGPVPA